jgi:preprotein translocase subunit Sss1
MSEPVRICKHCKKPKAETIENYAMHIRKTGSRVWKTTCRECRRILDRARKPTNNNEAQQPLDNGRPFRVSSKRCTLCANQPWRVVGPRCRGCKRLYADEPKVELVTHRHFERAV